MKFRKRYLLFLPVLFLAGAALGPKVTFPSISISTKSLDLPLDELDQMLATREAKVVNLKPDNQSRIIWADSIRKTPFSIIYLHGWSASPMEGRPVHQQLAKRYGCNLYLPRLVGHGIDDIESFKDLQPDQLMDDAKEAIDIGNLIGEKVIVMSCSTGGTMSIYLSAKMPDKIAAQLLYSPNIEIYEPTAKMLTGPWGRQLASWSNGGEKYRSFTPPPGGEQYWTTKYRLEGVFALQSLLDQTMTDEIFAEVKQPYFLGYYYKSDAISDHIVSVPAMLDYTQKTATPVGQKRVIAFPDVGNHVMISDIQADDYSDVQEETYEFLEEVMGLKPANK